MSIIQAKSDFNRERRKADLEQLLARFTGQSADLLSYEEVRRTLRANRHVDRGLQNVPLVAIVGSVGRYRDFTRTFLPKESTNEERWARIMVENTEGLGLPPVELYKIDEAYFVLDGNHRVSVARKLEMGTIEAYVKEVVTSVPFALNMNPDTLLIAQQYVDFVDKTGVDRLRPDADLQVTAPGKYELLLEHIEAHHYFMGLDEQRDILWSEAVVHWYDQVYLPLIALVREKGLMRDFPDRTETDFYIWLAEHRAHVTASLAWEVSDMRVVDQFADVNRPLLTRVNELIWETLTGGDVGREIPLATRRSWEAIAQVGSEDTVVQASENIMVNIDGSDLDWTAVAQTLMIAQRENSQVHALYFAEGATLEEQDVVRRRFAKMVSDAGLLGQIAVVEGNWSRHMLERSRWNDLVVLGIGGANTVLRQRPWRQIAIRCPRPVLLVPDVVSPLKKILLAYDGRKLADQALSLATYLTGRWQIALVVVIVGDETLFGRLRERVDRYLASHQVAASFVNPLGEDVAIGLLLAAEREGCDLIVMGTYSHTPVLEMVRGTAVNTMLKNAARPILICQ